MRTVIFANGVFKSSRYIQSAINKNELIIAVNGGTRHCISLGIQPDIIIGDMDSIDNDKLQIFKKRGTEILIFPRQKDQTDLELALMLSLERGADEIIILGALGKRWDMTLANILLFCKPDLNAAAVRILDADCEIILLRGGTTHTIYSEKGDLLSLMPLGGNVYGVTLSGLKYPLKNEMLNLGCTRGVSNLFLGKTAVIAIKKGLLLCVIEKKDKAVSNVKENHK